MRTRFLLFALVANIGCNGQSKLAIGSPLTLFEQINKDSTYNLLVTPSHTEKVYDIIYQADTFSVAIDKSANIKYITTSDKKFKSPEGATVGMTFRQLQQFGNYSKIINWRGWGQFVELKSGWRVVFKYEERVSDTSEILFLFKK